MKSREDQLMAKRGKSSLKIEPINRLDNDPPQKIWVMDPYPQVIEVPRLR